MEAVKVLWEGYLRFNANSSTRTVSWYEFAASSASLMNLYDSQRAAEQLPPAASAGERCLVDALLLGRLKHFAKVAKAAYETDAAKAGSHVNVPAQDFLVVQPVSRERQPAHYIFASPATKTLTLTIRGTKTVPDMITNLHCEAGCFLVGYAHTGMAAAAGVLKDKLVALLRAEEYDEVYVVGHSYGAAVATLITMMINKHHPNVSSKLQCYSFSPPPCISPSLRASTLDDNVLTVLIGSDVVPRLSERSFDRVLSAIVEHDWRQRVGSYTNGLSHSYFDKLLGEANVEGLHSAAGAISTFVALRTQQALSTSGEDRDPGGTAPASWLRSWSHQRQVLDGISQCTKFGGKSHITHLVRQLVEHCGVNALTVRALLARVRVQSETRVATPKKLVLAGDIIHMDHNHAARDKIEYALYRRKPSHFENIHLSSWMLHDHYLDTVLVAIEAIERSTLTT